MTEEPLQPDHEATSDGFQDRLLTLLAEAAKIPGDTLDRVRQDWLVKYNERYGDWVAMYLARKIVNPMDVEIANPFNLACPICQQPMIMNRGSSLHCEPCSARLYFRRDETDRRPAFVMFSPRTSNLTNPSRTTTHGDPNSWDYFQDDEELDDEGCWIGAPGDHITREREIVWDAESTSFGIHVHETYHGENYYHYEELGSVPEIMSPERARNRLQTLIVFG